MQRDNGGVVRIRAASLVDAMRQLGEAHATDRPAQMALMRIIAMGRATECLADDEQLLEVDRFFRWLGLYRGGTDQVRALQPRERDAIEAYCSAVNATMAARSRPMPFRLWGYEWEAWTPRDVVALGKLMAWVALVSAQFANEIALVELVQAGVSEARLLELFGRTLAGCDFAVLREVKLTHRVTPAILAASAKIGTVAASNAWALAPAKSRSGHALLCNDMHLEVNRLPALWYEAILEYEGHSVIGTTVPGLPGVVTGRNAELAWGVTYSHADTCDFFVEDCRNGKYKKDGAWHEFNKTTDTIERKKHPAETVEAYRNEHGLLLGNPNEDGKYLCLGWSAWHGHAGDVIAAMFDLADARSVREGMLATRRMHYPALNWVFADAQGNIGYRMGGLLPKRREGWSGLYPVPGWQSANDWLGFVEPESMPEAFNPEEGYLASANQDVSALFQTPLQSCPINDYRYRRICQLLETKDELDLEDMKAIQLDVHSLRADRLVPLLASALPDGAARARLLAWDREVTVDSRTATLFDALYQRALVAIFCGGEGAIPEAMFRHLQKETPVGFELDVFFERVLLSETSIWFGERTREQILQGAFAGIDTQDWPRWGEQNRIVMENIFFGGRLPRLLGVDRGPFEMPGSPDTPRQGTLFRDAGRATSFCPSQRFLTDLGKHEAWTVIPGGPSEKRFSGRYLTDVEAWLKGGYKLLRA